MQLNVAKGSRIDPPAVVVHGAADLSFAIAAACDVGLGRLRLLSAPDAACFLGPAWWRALMRSAGVPGDTGGLALEDVLDCGDAAGRAMEALRLGQRILMVQPSEQWPALHARAESVGAVLLPARPPALDLAGTGARRRLPDWLRQLRAADDSAASPG